MRALLAFSGVVALSWILPAAASTMVASPASVIATLPYPTIMPASNELVPTRTSPALARRCNPGESCQTIIPKTITQTSTQYVSCVTTFTIISDKLIPTTIWDTTVVTSIVTDVDSETVRVIVIQPSPIIEAVEFTQKLTFTAEYVGTSYHISTVDGRTQTSTDKGPKTRIDGGTSSPEPTDDLQRPPAPAEHTDTPEGPPADPIGEYSQPAWTKTTADVRANGNGRSGWVTGGSPFTMSHTGQNTTAVGGGVFGPASGTSTQNNSGVPPAGTTEGPFFSGTNVALSRDIVMASFGTSFLGFAFAFIL